MKTLDRLDHEEAREALALFSRMEAAAKGRDIDAILAASTNMVAETILRGCDSRKEAERIANDANGQSLAYFYARENDNDANTAGVLPMDEARRSAFTSSRSKGTATKNPLPV